SWFSPCPAHIRPARTESFLVSIAVLAHDCRDLFRMIHRQAPAHGCAEVEHVYRVTLQPHDGGERINHGSQPLKAVFKRCVRQDGGLAEPWQIGGKYAVAMGKLRYQIAEHVGGGSESVQQQHGRRVRWAGFTVKDTDPFDVHGTVVHVDWIVRPTDRGSRR